MCEMIIFFMGGAMAGLVLWIVILDNKLEDYRSGVKSPWIPVSERLPEASGPYRSKAVLIYCPSNKCIFAACYSFENSAWEYFATGSEMSITT